MASCFTVAGPPLAHLTVCSTRKSQQSSVMISSQQCTLSSHNCASISMMTPQTSGIRIRGDFPPRSSCVALAGSGTLWEPAGLQGKCVTAAPGSVSGRRQQRQRILRVEREEERGNRRAWRVEAGLKETELTEKQWGPPIRLGTAQLPDDVDLAKLQSLLYQWGSGLTQNANLPLPAPLKVDKVDGGVRLGYIRVSDGKVEEVVHIDVLVVPATGGSKAMFQAIRNGKMKNSVPPGEPMIMQSLLAALKKAVSLARP